MQIVPAVLEAPRDVAHKELLMDEVSVTCPAENPALASVVADANLCAQIADALGIGEESAERVFLGEPVEVVLAMAEWSLTREWDEGFDAEGVLLGWAEKRGRGAWSGRPVQAHRDGGAPDGRPSNGEPSKRELAVEVARYWRVHPEELVAALDCTARNLNGKGGG